MLNTSWQWDDSSRWGRNAAKRRTPHREQSIFLCNCDTTNLSSVGERKKLSPWLQCYSGRMQSMLHHICACFLHVYVVSHSHGHPLKHRCLHGCCCPPNCIPNYDWGPNLRVTRFPSDPTKRALWTRTNLERTCQRSDTRYIYDWMYTNKINLDSSVYRPVL